MPKKKGNLKAALHGHLASQELRNRERSAQEAAKRKALSVAKSQGLKGAVHAHKRRPVEHKAESHVAAQTANETTLQQAKRQTRRLVQPFTKEDSILIVGEANFSFALSLLLPPRNHPPSQILATAYDSEEECYAKYPDAQANVERIRSLAGRDDIVLFGVDAGQLDKHKQITGVTRSRTKASKQNLKDMTGGSTWATRNEEADAKRRWSKVWFGFPHVGAGHKDETRNILANQLLILRFLISVAPFLTAGPLPQHAAGASKCRKEELSDDEEEGVQDLDAEVSGLEELDEMTEADQTILAKTNAQLAALQSLRPPNKRGSVLITLRNASPYTLWDVANLAKRLPQMLPGIAASAPALPKGIRKPTLQEMNANGLSLKSPHNLHSHTPNTNTNGQFIPRRTGFYKSYHLWRSYEFDPTEWRGYQHRRTIGFIEGVSTLDNQDLLRPRTSTNTTESQTRASKAGGGECRTWEFGLE